MNGLESGEAPEGEAGADELVEPYVPAGMRDHSEEQAHMVLDELQEFVRELEPRAVASDAALREEMEGLLSALESLELPVSGGSATPESTASWVRVLALEGAHDARGGPEEIRALVDEEIDRMRELIALQAD